MKRNTGRNHKGQTGGRPWKGNPRLEDTVLLDRIYNFDVSSTSETDAFDQLVELSDSMSMLTLANHGLSTGALASPLQPQVLGVHKPPVGRWKEGTLTAASLIGPDQHSSTSDQSDSGWGVSYHSSPNLHSKAVENLPSLPTDLDRLLKNTKESYKHQEDKDPPDIDKWKESCILQRVRTLLLQKEGISDLDDLLRALGKPKELDIKYEARIQPRSIFFSYNENIEDNFRETHKKFFSDFSNNPEIRWAFHGTTNENARKIVGENFKLQKLRRRAYGNGMYFTSFYHVARKYGDYVLLCKIIVGYCTIHEDVTKNGNSSYDTKLINPKEKDQAGILVVQHPGQVRPLFITEP